MCCAFSLGFRPKAPAGVDTRAPHSSLARRASERRESRERKPSGGVVEAAPPQHALDQAAAGFVEQRGKVVIFGDELTHLLNAGDDGAVLAAAENLADLNE